MKKSLSVILSLVMIFVSVATLFVGSASAETQIPAGTNVIGYFNSESFYDSADFSFTAEQLELMNKYTVGEASTPILRGTADDLVTDYGSWSLTVDSTSDLRGANYPGFMPRPISDAMHLPLPISANAVRAVKGMKNGAEYTVSFKYKATESTAGDVVQFIMANKVGDCQPQDTAANNVYISNATTTEWQTASFDILNTYNDENGYVYIAFDNNGKNVYVDDLSIVEKPDDYVFNENNVIGKYAEESFYDSASFNFSNDQLAQMQTYNDAPIVLGTPDDLVTQYGTWSLTVASGAALRGDLKQYMPRALNNALYFPMPASAIAVRAIKGMKAGATYTVSFKYKADAAADKTILVGFADKYSTLRPFDGSAVGECNNYTSETVKNTWQTASFNIVNTYNDANGYAYIGFGLASALNFYIDNLSIVEVEKANVTATSNNTELGSVSGAGEYAKGETVTLTATPRISGCDEFAGWYNGDALVCSDAVYSFTANEDINLVAKFTTKNLIGTDASVYDSASFENVDTSNMITVSGGNYDGKPIFNAPQKNNEAGTLTTSPTVITDATGTGSLKETLAAFKNGDSYGSWLTAASSGKGKYIFSLNEGHTVKQSSENLNGVNNNFLLFPGSYSSSRAIKGLEPAREYTFSFKYKTGEAGKSLRVGLNANKTPHLTGSDVVVGTDALTTAATWQNATFTISNIEDFMDADGIVYLSVLSNLAGANVAIDDIAVVAGTKWYNVAVSSDNEVYGTVEGAGKFIEGADVTVTATPTKEYFAFDGWYNGDTKVSSDAAYTFTLNANTNLTAKFFSKNLIGKYDSVYDSYDFNNLDIEPNSVYNANFPTLVAPIDEADINADPENVKEGAGVISIDKLTNTIQNAKNTESDTYGSWFASADNKTFAYAGYLMPLCTTEYAVFKQNRYYSRAVAGLQNGKTYRIYFDYRFNSAAGGVISAGFSSNKNLYSLTAPVGVSGLEATDTWQTASFDVYNFYTDESGMTYFSIFATQDIRFDNFVIVDLEEDIIIDGEESVAISTKGQGVDKQGIRLYNRVDKNWAETSAKEYGSIVIRTSRLAELKELLDANGKFDLDLYNKYVAYVAENGGRIYGFGKGAAYTEGTEAKLWTDKCNVKVNAYTSYITGITPKYFAEEYQVRSYAIDKNNNVIYGDIRTISVYEVIFNIRKYYSDDAEGMEAADAFIAQAVEANAKDSTVVTYEQWLSENNLSEDVESEYVANLTMYNAPTVSSSTATALTVNNASAPVSTNFRGASGTVHFPYTYWVHTNGIGNYTQQQADFEFDRMRDAGYKYVRAIFKDTFVWDNVNNTFDWDSAQMQYFYSWAKSLQERGMEVVLNGPYTFLSHATGEQGWTYETEYMLGYGDDLFGEAVAAGVDYNDYSGDALRQKKSSLRVANFICEALKAFKSHGVNNVTHIVFFTEPAEFSVEHLLTHNLPEIYLEFLKDTNSALVRNNLRDSVKIIGPNSQQSAMLTGYDIINKVLDEMDATGVQLIDILSAHCYPAETEVEGSTVPVETLNTYLADYKEFFERFKAISEKYGWSEPEFWLDEFNVTAEDHTDGSAAKEEILNNPLYATQFAASYIHAMNEGISNVIVWNFTNQYWPNTSAPWYSNSITPNILVSKTPYQKYYGYALLAQHLGSEGGKVYETNDLWEDGLSASFVELSDGNLVFVVANTGTEDINFETTFSKAIGKNMYRHIYTTDIVPSEEKNAISADIGFTNVQNILNDIIPAGAIAVYTTKVVKQ